MGCQIDRCFFASISLLLGVASLFTAIHTVNAQAVDGFFIGDSIGEDTAQTIGMQGAAHHSVSLRRNAIAPQFRKIPRGAVALMSLGLNDAAIPVHAMQKDIEQVIEGALKTGEKVVWLGPPCVLKSWDVRAKEMDKYLRERLASTTIEYVSLRDERICHPAMRTRDGEHFTEIGYRYVWQKIRTDSKFAASITLTGPPSSNRAASGVGKPSEKNGAPAEALVNN